MPRLAKQASHSFKPPCHCPDCLRATAQSDQRRAEIAAFNTEIWQERHDAVILQSMKDNIRDSFLGLLENGFGGES